MTYRVFGLFLLAALGLPAPVAADGHRAADRSLRLALTGDAIISRKLSVLKHKPFLDMIELIRGADAAFTNIEILFHDYESFPMHQSGGTYMRADPVMARELAWAGFNLGSLANNHTGDFGVPAMNLTIRYAREAGIVVAGAGASLSQAREARFLDTAGGRVALISVASTFPDHSRASRSYDDNMLPRPGLSPLRRKRTYVITAEQADTLRQIAADLGLTLSGGGGRRYDVLGHQFTIGEEMRLFGRQFLVGDEPDTLSEPDPQDMAELEAVVSNAARLANHVLVSIHGHQRKGDLTVPADFLVTFSRAMIDAGADVVVGHGPHVLRGIEIYRGRPIFHGLGNFIFQNDTVLRLAQENYDRYGLGPNAFVADYFDTMYDNDRRGRPLDPMIWESVVAITNFDGDALASIELHPVSLGFGQPRPDRGTPQMADEETGRKIIADLCRLSAPFGTRVSFKDGIGTVDLEPLRGAADCD